jgi:hypothetical protein
MAILPSASPDKKRGDGDIPSKVYGVKLKRGRATVSKLKNTKVNPNNIPLRRVVF